MAMSVSGRVTLHVICADMQGFLKRLNDSGITLHSLHYIDILNVKFVVKRVDFPATEKIAGDYGATIKNIEHSGICWSFKRLLQRPVLILGLCFVLFLSVYLPTRVLFLSVEGNETIPERLIIEQAKKCGVVFGASRRKVRSEMMKNNLLSALPTLQWAGINTSGCTAIISVKERSLANNKQNIHGISNIIASHDGIVESCTSSKGSMQCKIGQAVTKGQVLISGYTDLGLCMKATKAEGEIYAQTKHELTVISPMDYINKGKPVSVHKSYGLILGKTRINFDNCSGIYSAGCDRIYSEYYVTLPGGFQLPIGYFQNVTTVYVPSAIFTSSENADALAEKAARQYLMSQMVSGQILQEYSLICQRDGACILSGRYICREMIGRVQYEEIYERYGKDN